MCLVLKLGSIHALLEPLSGINGTYKTRDLNSTLFTVVEHCEESAPCNTLLLIPREVIERRGIFFVQFTPLGGGDPIELAMKFGKCAQSQLLFLITIVVNNTFQVQ